MSQESLYYFAYGSNMWSGRCKHEGRKVTFKTIGKLKDFKLEFSYPNQRWRGHVANVIPTPGSTVWGVIWEVDAEALEDLDKQEGVADGIYERGIVELETEDGELQCIVYQQKEEIREKYKDEDSKPSKPYLDMIIRGANEHSLPGEYIQALEMVEHNGFEGEVNLDTNLSLQ